MEYIISDPINVVKVERIRAPQIYITNPYEGDTGEISFNSEKIMLLDGKVTAALPAQPVIRRVSNVVTELITIDDPVTGKSVTISIAGVAEVIGAFYCKWYKDDRDAETSRII